MYIKANPNTLLHCIATSTDTCMDLEHLQWRYDRIDVLEFLSHFESEHIAKQCVDSTQAHV